MLRHNLRRCQRLAHTQLVRLAQRVDGRRRPNLRPSLATRSGASTASSRTGSPSGARTPLPSGPARSPLSGSRGAASPRGSREPCTKRIERGAVLAPEALTLGTHTSSSAHPGSRGSVLTRAGHVVAVQRAAQYPRRGCGVGQRRVSILRPARFHGLGSRQVDAEPRTPPLLHARVQRRSSTCSRSAGAPGGQCRGSPFLAHNGARHEEPAHRVGAVLVGTPRTRPGSYAATYSSFRPSSPRTMP